MRSGFTRVGTTRSGGHQFFDTPYVIRDSGFHRESDAQGLTTHAAEVAVVKCTTPKPPWDLWRLANANSPAYRFARSHLDLCRWGRCWGPWGTANVPASNLDDRKHRGTVPSFVPTTKPY